MPAESALTVADKLRAALDRAEEIARAAASAIAEHGAWDAAGRRSFHDVDGMCQDERAFIVANGPDVVLRTVAAHRLIVDLHADDHTCRVMVDGSAVSPTHPASWPARPEDLYFDDEHCPTLLALAAVYFPEAPDAD